MTERFETLRRLGAIFPRMIRTAFTLIGLLIGANGVLAAQADRWQVTEGTDTYIWDVQLVRLDGDTLVVAQADSLVRVPLDHIAELRLIRKTEMRAGAEDADETMSALTGGDDEIYDLSTLELADRLRMIQKILLYHPTTP